MTKQEAAERCQHCAVPAALWRNFPCAIGETHEPWPDLQYVTSDDGRMIRVN